MAKLDIIIPVYNEDENIVRLLKALEDEVVCNFRVLICYDSESDKTLNYLKNSNIIKNENRPLLIFPQGTRVKVDDKVPFKKGVGRIYEALNISCIPIALNSGKVWPKKGIIKYPGKITVSFFHLITPYYLMSFVKKLWRIVIIAKHF